MTIFIAVLMFCVLVFVHEFGHFAAAKAVGIKVNEFSVGMGPLIFQRKTGETEYSLRAFPIGGYCKMEGEDEDSSDDRAFNRQPAWAKILVIVAGSFMNILATILVLAVVLTYAGSLTTTLDHVPEGYPAREAGLLPGDEIIAVDGQRCDDWTSVVSAIAESRGGSVSVTILREGNEQTFVSFTEENEEGRKVIGITPVLSHSVLLGTKEALRTTAAMMATMGTFLGQLITGQASSSDVVGPIGIVTIIGQQAQYGLINVVYLMAMISLNLGIVNLLPLPALDGGRLLFVLIRAVTGGRISDDAEARVHMIGMILLMGLMVFLVFKDTFQFIL
ncbi:MAG: RIP metalloprotease RseP [Eubacteriales bacterium]|nr:RIP metalloprotease RseP [Eubacteriales bacterium]